MFASLSLRALGMGLDDPAAVLAAAGASGYASAHIHVAPEDLPRLPRLAAIAREFGLTSLTWLAPPDGFAREGPSRVDLEAFGDLAAALRQELDVARVVTWVEDPLAGARAFGAYAGPHAVRALDAGLEFVVEPACQSSGAIAGWRSWFEQAHSELSDGAGCEVKLALEIQDWRQLDGLASDVEACARLIGDVHLSDVAGTARRLPMETGAIDACGVCDALRRAGYRGPLLAEPGRQEDRERGCARVRAARESLRNCVRGDLS